MKPAVSVLVLALFAACSATATEEKKTEKRGAIGLGYGLGSSLPAYGHGYYGSLSPYSGHYGHGYYGGLSPYSGYYGHGLSSLSLYGHGLYGGHGLIGAPVISKSIAAPLHYSNPWAGHGYWR